MKLSQWHVMFYVFVSLLLQACDSSKTDADPTVVSVKQGVLKGYNQSHSEVLSFKGIPYAAAPIGENRWRAPQPLASWKGVKKVDDFGHKCMQNPLFSDMQFRASGMSEDCLFLNIWAPVQPSETQLPVLVYFYGGGFVTGDGSEKRYDGADMASKGIITVTVNYRLGVFGFFAHPELSAETDYNGSGNYGLMDQQAALKWVAENIAVFGGDPKRITIAGESAGSISTSAHLFSADSIPYISGAVSESGSILGDFLMPLEEAEQQGVKLAEALGLANDSIKNLRSLNAQALLGQATDAGFSWFRPNIDGAFLSASPKKLLAQKHFADIPLIAGVNSQEGSFKQLLGDEPATVDNYLSALKKLYPDHFNVVAALYPAASNEEVPLAAQALMSDRFISESTWNLMDGFSQYAQSASYYYLYDHIRPPLRPEFNQGKNVENTDLGAVHSAEIEYVLGNLGLNDMYQWQEQDFDVARQFQRYVINFIQTGNPNGAGLVEWPQFSTDQQLVITTQPFADSVNSLRERYIGMAKLK